MIEIFKGGSADDVWLEAADRFRSRGNSRSQTSRAGQTHEILHAGLVIEDPRQRWVVSRSPPLNPAFAIAEVVWIITGRRDSEFLNYWNTKLSQFAGVCEEYHGAYGYRLRGHFGIDQLERAYQALSTNSESRQIVLQIWDAVADMPTPDGQPTSEDIPCNVMSLLKVRDGKLEWMQIIRSNDIFLGLPYNLVQFTYLQEVLAGWLGLGLGSYNQMSDSLHVYDSALNDVLSSSKVTHGANRDMLCERKELSERLFRELGDRISELASQKVSRGKLEARKNWKQAPVAYQNLLRVIAAEAARKAKEVELAHEIISSCTNPILTQLWERWQRRTATK